MKPEPETGALLAFGAHPDDIEFGCGGVIARETRAGRRAHLVVCSSGESASRGTPSVRRTEARRAAALLGATVEFVVLDGDARLEATPAHAARLAAIIRKVRPSHVLAPTLAGNQHPDHPRLGRVVREASRLARYGGFSKLRSRPPHAIGALLFYAVTPEAEPVGEIPVVIDVSDPLVLRAWTAAMAAHASQLATRSYVELQVARARVLGLRAGLDYAQALYPSDPLVFGSLGQIGASARSF